MAKRRKKNRARFFVYQSAITGKFVSRKYADKHKKTTIRQRV